MHTRHTLSNELQFAREIKFDIMGYRNFRKLTYTDSEEGIKNLDKEKETCDRVERMRLQYSVAQRKPETERVKHTLI